MCSELHSSSSWETILFFSLAVGGEARGTSSLRWPTPSDLNTRLRRIIAGYQRVVKKQELKKAAAEKVSVWFQTFLFLWTVIIQNLAVHSLATSKFNGSDILYWHTGKRKKGEVWRGCQTERVEESRNGPKVSFCLSPLLTKPLFNEVPLSAQPELHYFNCICLPYIPSLYGISAWQITFCWHCD